MCPLASEWRQLRANGEHLCPCFMFEQLQQPSPCHQGCHHVLLIIVILIPRENWAPSCPFAILGWLRQLISSLIRLGYLVSVVHGFLNRALCDFSFSLSTPANNPLPHPNALFSKDKAVCPCAR